MNLPTIPSSNSGQSVPPVTISRVYSGADVALRFLALLPDLGVIVVVGMLAYASKIESTTSLIALLAVLAGRLNPSALKLTGAGGTALHGSVIVPLVIGAGQFFKRFW